MASKQQIVRNLSILAITYPSFKFSPAELEILTGVWCEVMQGVSDEDFCKACLEHVRESKFFPSPAEVLERVKLLRRALTSVFEPEPVAVNWEKHMNNTSLLYRIFVLNDSAAKEEWGKRRVMQ